MDIDSIKTIVNLTLLKYNINDDVDVKKINYYIHGGSYLTKYIIGFTIPKTKNRRHRIRFTPLFDFLTQDEQEKAVIHETAHLIDFHLRGTKILQKEITHDDVFALLIKNLDSMMTIPYNEKWEKIVPNTGYKKVCPILDYNGLIVSYPMFFRKVEKCHN